MKQPSYRDQPEPKRGLTGRHRSEDKSPEEQLMEDKAKGHCHKKPAEPAEYEPAAAKDPKVTEQQRGHQKGYGKNQREEGESLHTQYGTRGAEHG